jgi:hypothetical protein
VGSKPPTALIENDASIDNKNRKKEKRSRRRKEEKARMAVACAMRLCVALYDNLILSRTVTTRAATRKATIQAKRLHLHPRQQPLSAAMASMSFHLLTGGDSMIGSGCRQALSRPALFAGWGGACRQPVNIMLSGSSVNNLIAMDAMAASLCQAAFVIRLS